MTKEDIHCQTLMGPSLLLLYGPLAFIECLDNDFNEKWNG